MFPGKLNNQMAQNKYPTKHLEKKNNPINHTLNLHAGWVEGGAWSADLCPSK